MLTTKNGSSSQDLLASVLKLGVALGQARNNNQQTGIYGQNQNTNIFGQNTGFNGQNTEINNELFDQNENNGQNTSQVVMALIGKLLGLNTGATKQNPNANPFGQIAGPRFNPGQNINQMAGMMDPVMSKELMKPPQQVMQEVQAISNMGKMIVAGQGSGADLAMLQIGQMNGARQTRLNGYF
jgi:hypothetical protein